VFLVGFAPWSELLYPFAMLTYRRSLLVALSLVTLFLLFRHTEYFGRTSLFPSEPKDVSSESSRTDPSDKRPELPAPAGLAAHYRKKDQVPLSELSKKPLRQQLAYQFPYDLKNKFPNYIWQTWKYTPASGEFEENFRGAEASWTELHPGFIHQVITDHAALHVLRHLYSAVPDILEAYNALPRPVLKADFFRYLILLARGGIYTDIDTAAIKSAVDWVPAEVPRSSYGLVIGIEADPNREDWAQWYSRRIQFCQWTIQAKPGHPVLREIVAKITEDTLRRRKEGTLNNDDVNNVVEFTGPAIWTDVIMRFFNDPEYFNMSASKGNITWRQFTGITQAKKVGDVVVLPITCFSPGIQTMGAGEDDDPMAFVKHLFEGMIDLLPMRMHEPLTVTLGTWKPERERHIGEQ